MEVTVTSPRLPVMFPKTSKILMRSSENLRSSATNLDNSDGFSDTAEKDMKISDTDSASDLSCSGGLFATFVIFGIASLTPWNMFITATAYFESKFNGSSASIEQNFPNYFQTGAICCDVMVSFLTVVLIRYIPIPALIYFSNAVMMIMFAITTILSKVHSADWSTQFFVVTEISFCMMCGGGAMYISTMWAISSSMNTIYTEAFLIGMTLAGIIASVLNIVTLSIPGINFVDAGFWYFLSATIILALALTLFAHFHTHHYTPHHYSKIESRDSSESDTLQTSSDPKSRRSSTTCDLNKATAPFGYTIFCVLFVTFLMFPATLSMLQSTGNNEIWATRYYKAVIVFLCYNLGDLNGRFIARAWEFPGRRLIPWYTSSRVVFVVLLGMCYLQPRTLPVWFAHDAIPGTLIFFLGTTSGQCLSLCMRYAPEVSESKASKATIGTIMAFWGAIGRVGGSLATYALIWIIQS